MMRIEFVRVGLRIQHPTASAEEIAATLGLTPSRTGVKGGVRGAKTYRVPAPGSRRAVWRFHYAAFSFGDGDGREQLSAALLAIERGSAEISRLARSGGNAMLVIFAAPSFGWGVVMTTKELEQLSQAGVELGIDIHRDPLVTGEPSDTMHVCASNDDEGGEPDDDQ